MAARAVAVETERPGLVESGPVDHAVAQRCKDSFRKCEVVWNDTIAQPAVVAVLQHLPNTCGVLGTNRRCFAQVEVVRNHAHTRPAAIVPAALRVLGSATAAEVPWQSRCAQEGKVMHGSQTKIQPGALKVWLFHACTCLHLLGVTQECRLMTEEVWMQTILTCSPIKLAPALVCLRAQGLTMMSLHMSIHYMRTLKREHACGRSQW